MRAAILSIGSELVYGFLTDTNATFLCQELNALGIEVVGVFQVGDDLQRIVATFRRALEDADVVIATGGIGPTDDDLTREAVAQIAGEQVRVDDSVADHIREYFTLRGIPMPEQNVKQAWVIPSSEVMTNPMGTAPGWFVRLGEKRVAIMPGVPREMFRMWREQVVPRLSDVLSSSVIVSRTLKTIGIGESAVEQQILAAVRRGYPIVATYAKDDGVHIRITAISDNDGDAKSAVEATESEIRDTLAPYVYGYLDDPLASAILRPIIAEGHQLAIVEAGNAGRLTAQLADVPEADRCISGSRVMSFDTGSLRAETQDPVDVAVWCVGQSPDRSVSEWACAIAVHIGPDGTNDRSAAWVGLAVRHPTGLVTRAHEVTAIPTEIRRRATMWALDFLWSTVSHPSSHSS